VGLVVALLLSKSIYKAHQPENIVKDIVKDISSIQEEAKTC